MARHPGARTASTRSLRRRSPRLASPHPRRLGGALFMPSRPENLLEVAGDLLLEQTRQPRAPHAVASGLDLRIRPPLLLGDQPRLDNERCAGTSTGGTRAGPIAPSGAFDQPGRPTGPSSSASPRGWRRASSFLPGAPSAKWWRQRVPLWRTRFGLGPGAQCSSSPRTPKASRVSSAAEGRGAGRTLVEAAEAWARSEGLDLITLNVFANNERARALYQRLGYAPDTLHYVKPLT